MISTQAGSCVPVPSFYHLVKCWRFLCSQRLLCVEGAFCALIRPLVRSVGQTKSDKERSRMDGNFLITGAAQGFGKEFTRRVLRGTSVCCFHLSKNKFASTSFTSWAAHCAKHCKRHHMDQGNERRLTLKFNEHL